MSKTPAHWPANVLYISEQHYHASVPSSLKSQLCPTNTSAREGKRGHQALVVIRPIREQSHPAHGQYGLFAAKKIPPKSHILDYIGEVHCDERPCSDYDLSLYRAQDGTSVGVDASKMGNEARYVNDYRGIRPKPNAIFEERRNSRGELCMSVWSMSEGIKKGEEILVSYGKSWWKARVADFVDSSTVCTK
ncbi:SET domain protein [Panus rudis PR-1116 ss-1]|nr:SET domain protein [Panus rudis PR-1116 ss-1]